MRRLIKVKRLIEQAIDDGIDPDTILVDEDDVVTVDSDDESDSDDNPDSEEA